MGSDVYPPAFRHFTGSQAGPASYSAGGFTIDLSASLSQIDFIQVVIETVGANLPPCHFEITRNSPGAGQATVKVMRHRYDRATIGDTSAQNPPAGVTISGTSGQSTNAEAAHTHAVDHDHASFSSGAAQSAGINPTAGVAGLSADDATHQHTVDVPAFTGASGAGSSHSHVTNVSYQHGHSVTQTETNAASVELGATTDLSGSTFRYFAVGQ